MLKDSFNFNIMMNDIVETLIVSHIRRRVFVPFFIPDKNLIFPFIFLYIVEVTKNSYFILYSIKMSQRKILLIKNFYLEVIYFLPSIFTA